MKKINLTQGKFALVDDEDFDFLNQWKWHFQKDKNGGYAKRKESNGNAFFMHRVIAKTPDGMITDHINHDTLDNRKENLRICTHSENQANRKKVKGTSKYKGVSFVKERNVWRSGIKINGKSYNLGEYATEEQAALAYNKKALEYFGQSANINNI